MPLSFTFSCRLSDGSEARYCSTSGRTESGLKLPTRKKVKPLASAKRSR